MTEFGLPRSDEPFDFRRQARLYQRYRRNYSAALYDAIEARSGHAGGRSALDVGCGTGFVTSELRRRGWQAAGVDFSGQMLTEARRVPGAPLPLVQARGEILPVASGTIVLLTSGTAFHWLAPAPALAEFERVLRPGGWSAVFWRYAAPEEPSMQLVAEVLGRFGSLAREGVEFARELTRERLFVHPPDPFAGCKLVAEPVLTLDGVLAFTPEAFHGYVATLEWIRRLAGPDHGAFLDALHEELELRHPNGFEEQNREYLFLARQPG
jgi:SAM-dependent methyltransferase